MPQDSLLPDQPTYYGYRMSWEAVPHQPNTWHCTISRRQADRADWETVHHSEWVGEMMDLASTMAEDCQNAFFYDEARGLARAAATVKRLARLHRARFSRSTL